MQREAGVFGQVTVTWSANGIMAAELDLTPTSGRLDFAEGQTTAVIEITTVDDQVCCHSNHNVLRLFTLHTYSNLLLKTFVYL